MTAFLAFLVTCYAFARAVVSFVNRVKAAVPKKYRSPGLTWALSLAAGEILAFGIWYVFTASQISTAAPGLVAIVGALMGLHASGLVDLSEYVPARQ